MNVQKFFALIAVSALISCGGNSGEESSTTSEANAVDELVSVPEGASVFFANLQSGDEVTSPVYVEMGVEGMTIEPAGELIPGTGHHHIIIGAHGINQGEIVPADETHIHYGLGETSDSLELEPGDYTLTLQFANGAHQSYGEQMAASVEIIVK